MAEFSSTAGSTDLGAILKDLERQRQVIDEKIRAVRLVQTIDKERAGAVASVADLFRDSLSSAASTHAVAPPMPEGLTEAVKRALEAFDDEFDVRHVEEYLELTNFPLPKAEPRSRIAMVLIKLVERGLIERTFEGSGRTPHRYRVIKGAQKK